jgi:hypothetical protein
MQYIYNFPELKPGIWAGNTEWFRTPTLFLKKLSAFPGLEQIVINGPLILYEELQASYKTNYGVPIVSREMIGPTLPPNTLSLYFVNYKSSVRQFEKDFEKTLGDYGEVLPLLVE